MSPHAGRRPLSMRATLSCLIWKPFACISSRIALSDLPWARRAAISRMASCCAPIGTSTPSAPTSKPKGTSPPRKRPLDFWSAFACPILSRMRSRSASAKAAAMVKNSLLIPLPAMSPPRSSRCSLTPLPLRLSTTLSASRAERNKRSCLAAMTMSPRCSLANSWPPI
jgi:hypothetical protein